MYIHPWMIKAWPTVEWRDIDLTTPKPNFVHAGTRLHHRRVRDTLHSGETVWILKDGPEPIGLAWEWSEILHGIVMLSDPNSVVTNLKYVDKNKLAMPLFASAIVHNRLVHGISWQREIRQLLTQRSQQTRCASPAPISGPTKAALKT